MPNYLTFTRQALYDLVWSKPMSQLAKEFGISDVALAKRCKLVAVPVPPRGYWARIAAGQTPAKTPLPRRRGEEATSPSTRKLAPTVGPDTPDTIAILNRPPPEPVPEKPLSARELEIRDWLITHPPKVADDLRRTHPAIRRTALALKALKVKDLDWNRGERAGPIVEIRVSDGCRQRALRLADAILRAAERLDWPFVEDPKPEPDRRHRYGSESTYTPPNYGRLLVDGEPMRLMIDERHKHGPHVPTEYEKRCIARGEKPHMAPWDLYPTGRLRIHLTQLGGWKIRTLADTARHALESALPGIFHAMIDQALRMKADREEERLAELRRREQERLERKQRERQDFNAKLIGQLETEAGAWFRAQLLRRYLRAIRRAFPNATWTVDGGGHSANFLDWADRYINQLDPLHPEARNPDMHPPRDPYYRADDEAFKHSLARLSGQRWPHSTKYSAIGTDGPGDEVHEED